MSESSNINDDRNLAVIIMAAGKGTRMPGDLPKVAHPVADRPMISWVVDAARAINANPIVLVVGYGQDVIKNIFAECDDIHYSEQSPQLGTAHAVDVTRKLFEDFKGDVLVLAGDGPLIRKETLKTVVDIHRSSNAVATLASSIVDNPSGYGRIIRNANGEFEAIVEDKNTTPEQQKIKEINPSYYCFDCEVLFDTLSKVKRNSVSGEYYLTDVPGILKEDGLQVEVIDAVPCEDVLSINTLDQLEIVDAILSERLETCR